MVNGFTTLAPGARDKQGSPMEGLARASLVVMQLLRIGPYGTQQRLWQQAMESATGAPLATNLPLNEALEKHDTTNKRQPGQARHGWTAKVIEPALDTVAQVLSELHVFSDHPEQVQQGLFLSGLLPGQAAERIRASRKTVATAIAKALDAQTVQTLRCPGNWKEIAWSQQSPHYVAWSIDCRRGTPQQPVVYPVNDTLWGIEIRRWPLPLRVTLNAQNFEADLQQRLWTLNRVKVFGTLLWHPKMPMVSTSLLRNIANTDPAEKGISELARHLKEQQVDAIAGPIVLVDAIEKSSDVSHEEVVHATQSMADALLKVHQPGQKVGSIVWNGLPAPWLYPPQRDELLSEDWGGYERACASVSQTLGRIGAGIREEQGHAMFNLVLSWERNR